jgi:hypothetical protein
MILLTTVSCLLSRFKAFEIQFITLGQQKCLLLSASLPNTTTIERIMATKTNGMFANYLRMNFTKDEGKRLVKAFGRKPSIHYLFLPSILVIRHHDEIAKALAQECRGDFSNILSGYNSDELE